MKIKAKTGKCIDCGECCTNILFATDEEINTIKKYIKENKIEVKSPYSIMNNTYNSTCPFLNSDKRCKIYPVRLNVCRSFSCKEELHQEMDYRNTKVIDMLDTFGENLYYPCKPDLNELNKEWKKKVGKAYV